MLTIKVIEDDGSEFVKAGAKAVAFNPPLGERAASLFVWYKDGYEPPETYWSGKIFVMNENGKTIADYKLYGYPAIKKDIDIKVE